MDIHGSLSGVGLGWLGASLALVKCLMPTIINGNEAFQYLFTAVSSSEESVRAVPCCAGSAGVPCAACPPVPQRPVRISPFSPFFG